jgi:small subunit ribosomal protein S21
MSGPPLLFYLKGIGCENFDWFGEKMVKLLVRDKESVQEAVRRFRKRSGIKKEMRRREYYEKPSETKRRARLRAERRSKRNRMLAKR